MKALQTAVVRIWVALFLVLPTVAMAQTANEIQAKVTHHKSALKSNSAKLETTLNRLKSYQFKIQDAQQRLAQVKKELVEAEQNLAQADLDKSDEGKRLRDIAARRLELAHHNVEAHQARLERVVRKSEELQASADKLGTEIEWSEKQLIKLADTLKLTTAAEKAAAELEKRRLEEALARAKAEEEKARQEAAREAKRLEEETARLREAERQQQLSAEQAVTADSQAKPPLVPPLTTLDDAANLTPLQLYARREIIGLNQRIHNSDKSTPQHFLKLLMEIDDERVLELEYLGNNQFYSELPLSKGKHKIIINLRRFVATVPDEADGDTFIVIFDASNPDDGRFVIFNKYLL